MSPAARQLASQDQRRATAPNVSAWVEANAGTGKTKVLIDRVCRLLLAGARPERILCLTFTKAAASEMRVRLAETLGKWALADDAALAAMLEELSGGAVDQDDFPRARRLFAQVLDAPGGISIQTLHSFCQALLKRFPLEAGVPPGFEVLDEAAAETLLLRARDAQLAAPDAPSLAAIARRVSMKEYGEQLDAVLKERSWLAAHGEDAMAGRLGPALRRMLRAPETGSHDEIIAAACEETAFDSGNLRQAAAAFARGSKSEREKTATKLADWLNAAPDERHRGWPDYRKLYFTVEGEVRNKFGTKESIKAMATLPDVMRCEAERIGAAEEAARGADLADMTSALVAAAADILNRYGTLKLRRAALDYDDLIVAARGLLESADGAAWVLYKLDGGIEHVLVDEAQDTNPDQWEVVRHLTGEFFIDAGLGARQRTIFAVGDTKQSIYGFQRADPAKLADMRDYFVAQTERIEAPLRRVPLNVSFRSTQAVLDAVDWVFDRPDASQGLGRPGDVSHDAVREDQYGRVEVWPLIHSEGEDSPADPESDPADQLAPPRERLARQIARHARTLVETGRRPDGRRLDAGDLMILVRRRNALQIAMVRELKRVGLEVAGVDRITLGNELAVMDLLALARFALLPADDLTLASLLKSPLVGFDEETLFDLAWRRQDSLWAELSRRRAERPDFTAAHAFLAAALARADRAPPFEFFARVLGPGQGRRRLLERLGREADDPIDELLQRALHYQRADAPSLQGFLRWIETGGQDVKRELDTGLRREVRILTVHGAKGLQAPVVYLPDTCRVPQARDALLWPEDRALPVWLPRVGDVNPAARALKDAFKRKQEEEQNRLLYVAMTRAEDRLYVCGSYDKQRPSAGCWYERVVAGLEASANADPEETPRTRATPTGFDFTGELGADGWEGDGYVLESGAEAPPEPQGELAAPRTPVAPAWALVPPEKEPDPPRPLQPSRPLADEAITLPVPVLPGGAAARRAARRGALIHRLLELLPALPPVDRAAAARRFLAQPAHALAGDDIERWSAEALSVLEAPEHAALFAADARAEVGLIGTVETPAGRFTVSGQVDRLAVTAGEVLIVDYKTGAPADGVAEMPLAYRRQLALYRALLAHCYPDRRIRAAILWTQAPRLDEIPAETLENSLPGAAP